MFRLARIATLVLILAAGAPDSAARACTCLPTPGIEHVYASATHVVRVRIRQEVRRVHRRGGLPTVGNRTRAFRAKVKESFKGCLRRGRILKLVTSSDGGLCGAQLDPRREYVVALGEGDRNVFAINACDFIRRARSLTAAEWNFLDTRLQCCNGRCRCTGSDPTSCFADPCQLDSCGDASCTANFCGGCNAEFFRPDGQPVCTPCSGPFDCGAGQACSEGLCVPRLTDLDGPGQTASVPPRR